MFSQIKEDVRAALDRDPAATSALEVFFLYPGVKAIRAYRRAHRAYLKGHKFLARMISQRAARKTGIEIHPGAKVLGPLHIGDNSRVAAGAVVLENVPANCTVVGVPARLVKQDGKKVYCASLDQIHIPDPIAQEIARLEKRITALEGEKNK